MEEFNYFSTTDNFKLGGNNRTDCLVLLLTLSIILITNDDKIDFSLLVRAGMRFTQIFKTRLKFIKLIRIYDYWKE